MGRRSGRSGDLGRHFRRFISENRRRVITKRRLNGLRTFQRILTYFFGRPIGLPIRFHNVKPHNLRRRTKSAKVSVRNAFMNVAILARLCVNSILRFRRLTIFNEASSSITRLLEDGRTSHVFRNVLVHLVQILAGQPNNQFSVLLYRRDHRVQECRLMLHRSVQFRPSARAMIAARGRRVTRAKSA